MATLKPGSIINVKEILMENHYIESPNRLFYALMQEDGNFVVYRGRIDEHRGPLWASDKFGDGKKFYAAMQPDGNFVVYTGMIGDRNNKVVWETNTANRGNGSNFFAQLQDDGNFVVYTGIPPYEEQLVWATNKTENLTWEADEIKYDVDAAEQIASDQHELYQCKLRNNTLQTQIVNFERSGCIDEQSGWENTLGLKVGVEASGKLPIPFVAEGEVKVSTEFSGEWKQNGSTITKKEWRLESPITLAPQTETLVKVRAMVTKIKVPYTVKAKITYENRNVIYGEITGDYVGTNSHDLEFSFDERELIVTPGSPEPPPLLEVDAGEKQKVRPETKVTLRGRVLGNRPPGELSFQWMLLKGPAVVKFNNERGQETQATLKRIGTYVFQFKASTDGQIATDKVEVEVVKN